MKGKEVETVNIQKFFSMSFAIIREQNSGNNGKDHGVHGDFYFSLCFIGWRNITCIV